VRTINLAGAGIKRTLTSSAGMMDREVLIIFLSSKDYAYKDQFAFFDLPAGDYTLLIQAAGCEPCATIVVVKPGEFVPPPPFRLIIK